MSELHVIFGTGPLGIAVMRQLRAAGHTVRMLNRSGHVPFTKDLETQVGGINANDPQQTREVCEGAAAVYHCIGLPYDQWQRFPAIASAVIEGAASADAPLVYADNLYAYGPVGGAMHEDLPEAATTKKGIIRSAVARMLLESHRNGTVRVAIGRASDFFGAHATQNAMMGSRVFGRALAGKRVQVIGNPDRLHTYTWLDDFARALVIMGGREDALGRIWHVPSAPAVSTRRFVEMVCQAAKRKPRLSSAPRFMLKLIGRFNPQVKELMEMLYQFEDDFVMDSSRFERTFGVTATPLEQSIAATLEWFRVKE